MKVTELQTLVGTAPDGDFGPKSLTATLAWFDRLAAFIARLKEKYPESAVDIDKFFGFDRPDPVDAEPATLHPRTEENLKTLSPKTQALARRFIRKANDEVLPQGTEIRIISGSRTYDQQNALYMQGRGYSLDQINKARAAAGWGPIDAKDARTEVTRARGGQSHHNFAIAFDIGVFVNGAYQGESPWYVKLGPVGEAVGLDWGGRWTKPDQPHYEFKTGFTLAELRKRHEQGMPIG